MISSGVPIGRVARRAAVQEDRDHGAPSYNRGMESSGVERILREFFTAQTGEIIAAYLFGSVARKTSSVGSDVDVAVLYAATPHATLEGLPLDLAARIEHLVKRPVQVIVLNTAPADLVHRVLRDGVLLIDRDPSARIRFEVQARNEFFDLQPILDRYRRRPVPAR